MKTKLFLLLIFLLVTIRFFGQELTKDEIVKYKIKSVSIIDADSTKSFEIFDENGNIIKKGSFDIYENIQINKEFVYNELGCIIEETSFRTDGEINSIQKYFYNPQNQLVKEEHSDPDGDFKSFWIYEYDTKGNKISEVQTSGTMGNSVTSYKYNDNLLLIQEEKSNNSIGREEKISYKYNEKKQLIEKKTKYFFGGGTIALKYSYNALGKLVMLSEKSSNGVSSTTIYEYDQRGLLIGVTWKGSISKTEHKTTYKINIQ